MSHFKELKQKMQHTFGELDTKEVVDNDQFGKYHTIYMDRHHIIGLAKKNPFPYPYPKSQPITQAQIKRCKSTEKIKLSHNLKLQHFNQTDFKLPIHQHKTLFQERYIIKALKLLGKNARMQLLPEKPLILRSHRKQSVILIAPILEAPSAN